MGRRFADLPHWEFSTTELPPGDYRVLATRYDGLTGEYKGPDTDTAMIELKKWALGVDGNLPGKTAATRPLRNRLYKTIVWIGELPGKRLSIWAPTGKEASAQVAKKFGNEAIFTIHNDEDAARPRQAPRDNT